MEQMLAFPKKFLPQARRSLTFIRYQLKNMTDYCDEMLQDDQVNPYGFLVLDNLLQKVLHDTRAVCDPPVEKPKKSDFNLVKSIAIGSFGSVNHVRHKQTGQSFAMKEIKKVKKMRDSVLRERDILNFLQHPLFISMYCSFETKSHQYMVMEYVRGGDFYSLLEQHTYLSLEASRFYIAELVLAVEHLHNFGILHRDIKLENLLISSQGHLKLVDFGLSKLGSVATVAHHTGAEKVAREFTDRQACGTLLYMAPEMLLREAYGKPIDWWAVGCILFNFLNGSYPFSGETTEEYVQQVIKGNIHWSTTRALLPFESWNILCLLLHPNPAWRLGTRGASEVKKHPFFKGMDWERLMYQTPPYVPELVDEDETTCSQMTSSPELIEDRSRSPEYIADFCYVGVLFKEVYGSPRPLSHDTLLNRFLLVTTAGLEAWNEGFVDEMQPPNQQQEEGFLEEVLEEEEQHRPLWAQSCQHYLLEDNEIDSNWSLITTSRTSSHKSTDEESSGDDKPTVEESPPAMNTLNPQWRMNPMRKFFRRLRRLNPFSRYWPSAQRHNFP